MILKQPSMCPHVKIETTKGMFVHGLLDGKIVKGKYCRQCGLTLARGK